MWCPVSEIKWHFDLGDLPHPWRLANRIQQHADPVSMGPVCDDTKGLFESMAALWGLVENPIIHCLRSTRQLIIASMELALRESILGKLQPSASTFNALIKRNPVSTQQTRRLSMATGLGDQLIVKTEHYSIEEVIQRVVLLIENGHL
jgi:hypothetical protein